jgi:hypothetical protein
VGGVVHPARDPALDPDAGEHVGEPDQGVVALCRERGALRSVLARIAARLVFVRAWERIGYARLSDYAAECLGLSGRSLRSLAEVGTRLRELPRLEQALVSGTLGWTKVRLLARLPRAEDETRWLAHARRVTAEELSRAVRAVDRGSIEAGAAEEEGARGRLFEVRCSPEVRWKWVLARKAAARAAGRVLHISEAAELIAAEVLSALPIAEGMEDGACDQAGASWRQKAESSGDAAWGDAASGDAAGSGLRDTGSLGLESFATGRGRARSATSAHEAERPPWRVNRAEEDGADAARSTPRLPRPSLPSALEPLLEGLEDLDAFALDERLKRALSLAQRLDARIGALLAPLWGRFLHRALGYASREAYARERLGMDPTRARALVRLERAALASAPFARAYRTGGLSWVKAAELVPLVSADPLGWFMEDWVGWAGRVTVRRLREDVEHALALAETDPVAFRRGGGLPAEAHDGADDEREIGAAARGPNEPSSGGNVGGADVAGGDKREIGAAARDGLLSRHPEPLKSAPDEVCWARFIGPSDIVRLFRAVLCTVRRRVEQDTGRLPTAGAALGVMLDHVLSSWGVLDDKLAARYRVFARDGWRCAVPGCTSLENLHDHHIRFRSAGGSSALDNRITLCAFHHLRGVHAGLLRCVGRAPDGLRWELGIRPGVTPLLAYRSGDIRISQPIPLDRLKLEQH